MPRKGLLFFCFPFFEHLSGILAESFANPFFDFMERKPTHLTKVVSMTALLTALAWGADAQAAETSWCKDEGSTAVVQEQVRECVFGVKIEEPDSFGPFEKIMEIVSSNPDFLEDDLVDIAMYGQIYMRVGEKYQLPWYLLWIVHKAESRVSRDPNAFNGSSRHIGGFQRDPGWRQSVVDAAAEGLEDLAGLPQRHPTDWREAAFAGWHLAKIRKVDTEIIRGALRSYSAQEPALDRYQVFLEYQQIFEVGY